MYKKLSELLCGIETVEIHADLNTEICGVSNDSRKVKNGELFIAVRGYESDGHRFIGNAVSSGAACVVCEEAPSCDVPYVLIKNSRMAEAVIASNFYGRPSEKMTMIGVTGTNGKTTVTTLLKQLIEKLTGEKVGLIGTNKNMIGDAEIPTERTTPDSIELQELFGKMADSGCRYVVMEVSSHALYLDRVYGVRFEVGAFTNLTEDHLDFHKTMENYAEAKAILFSRCSKAVINLDDKFSDVMINGANCPVYTFSTDKNEADLTAKDIRLENDSVSFCALTTGKIEKIRLGIPGMFSVYNALTVLSILVNLGIDLGSAANALNGCRGVKGRAEIVPVNCNFTVMIDYAHTPDALTNILNTVRGFVKGRIILVFGCGGDREKEKRPVMGKIAGEMADVVFVTSDNPRTEEPAEIISEIVSGIGKTGAHYTVIVERRDAIAAALSEAREGDLVLLAGKGHETYQIIGREKSHFDEREIVAEILAK